jgi:hypothetical protein
VQRIQRLRQLLADVLKHLERPIAEFPAPSGPLSLAALSEEALEVRAATGRRLAIRADVDADMLRFSESVCSVSGSEVDRVYEVHYGSSISFAFRIEPGNHTWPEFTGIELSYFVEAIAATVDANIRARRHFPSTNW